MKTEKEFSDIIASSRSIFALRKQRDLLIIKWLEMPKEPLKEWLSLATEINQLNEEILKREAEVECEPI